MSAAGPRRPAQDVLAGLMFMAFGAAAVVLGRDYPIGSSAQMGAGYFPMMVGGLLIVVGLAVAGTGLRRDKERFRGWSARASVFIGLAFLIFTFVVERGGLLVTAPMCMLLAAKGSPNFRIWHQLILATVATVAAAGIFVWGLKIPIPLLPQL